MANLTKSETTTLIGGYCPACGGDGVEYGEVEITASEVAQQKTWCYICDAEWTAVFSFKGAIWDNRGRDVE